MKNQSLCDTCMAPADPHQVRICELCLVKGCLNCIDVDEGCSSCQSKMEEAEQYISDQKAKEQAINAKCCICKQNYVDAMNGEDTCQSCLRKQ